jgi:hypothetical protein
MWGQVRIGKDQDELTGRPGEWGIESVAADIARPPCQSEVGCIGAPLGLKATAAEPLIERRDQIEQRIGNHRGPTPEDLGARPIAHLVEHQVEPLATDVPRHGLGAPARIHLDLSEKDEGDVQILGVRRAPTVRWQMLG